LSEKDLIKTNIGRYGHAFKLSKLLNEPDMIYRKADYIFNLIGATLNTAAFLNTIELLGNDEQASKWRQLVFDGKVFGGYGQTELGHGSNVQGLETEAHYD
jgi:acyl-CoA oxidase